MVIHDARVDDVDDGLACRMVEPLREMRSLVHLPSLSRGIAVEVIRHYSHVCEVARIEPRFAAIGP